MLDHAEDSPASSSTRSPAFEPGYRVLVERHGQPQAPGDHPRPGPRRGLPRVAAGLLARPAARLRRHAAGRGRPRRHPGERPARRRPSTSTRFPAPIWHPLDGGRYIGTASLNITARPGHAARSTSGTYRNQVFDRNSVGIRVAPPHHGGIIQREVLPARRAAAHRRRRGRRSAAVHGVLRRGLRFGESELDWAGGVRGAADRGDRGRADRPADPRPRRDRARGLHLPDECRKEGPYGEWMGYYQDGLRARQRSCASTAIYHRNNPIILGCPQGKPPHEDNRFLAYLRSGLIWDQLRRPACRGSAASGRRPRAATG